MKILLYTLLAAIMLLLTACSEKADNLVEVDMNNLEVPQGFNYDMSRNVAVDIQGAYRLPLTIKSTDGVVLFRAYLNPATGINTQLNLPSTIKSVVVLYQRFEQTVSISNNSLSFDFSTLN